VVINRGLLPAMRSPERLDWAVAAALAGFGVLEVAVYDVSWASVLSVVVGALALIVRRRAPLLLVAAAVLSPILDRLLGGPWFGPQAALVAALLAAYSVAAFASTSQAVVGGLVVMASVWLRFIWTGVIPGVKGPSPGLDGFLEFGYYAALVAMPWIAGRAARAQSQRAETLNALMTQLEREREGAARLAVAEERERLARELSDAVSGSVGAMLDQAHRAERAISVSAAACASRALQAVQELGREAIADLRRLLQVLRSQTPDAGAGQARSYEIHVPPSWRSLPWSWRHDLVLAGGTLVLYVVELHSSGVYQQALQPAASVLLLPLCLSLFWRRRYPVAVLLTVISAEAARHVMIGSQPPAPLAGLLTGLAVIYSAAVYASARRSAPAVVVGALELWVAFELTGLANPRSAIQLVVLFGLPFLSGRALRGYRVQSERLEVLAERLRAERDALARLAVLQERTRMARELHDSVAHAVSVMVIQAGASEAVLAAAPERCRQALHTVLDAGREGLAELARLLAVLRTGGDSDSCGPQPTLSELEKLVVQTRHAGLPVTLHIEGNPSSLPASVDASAFRIVQEGLTNALKHAGSVPTDVTVRYERDGLGLEILNSGGDRVVVREAGGVGHGLVGMRERVALHHGSLQVGPQPTGGFRVSARLPVTPER
jgi:signal transduction histidine kinase